MKSLIASIITFFLFCSNLIIVYGIQISVKTNSLIATTDNVWPCVNFDHWPATKCDYGYCQWLNNSLYHVDLQNPLLQNAVKAFNGNIRIRMGGTLADSVLYDIGATASKCVDFSPFNTSYRWGYVPFTGCLKMSRWDQLNEFCTNNGASILFGVNGLYGRRYIGCSTVTNCSAPVRPDCCSNWTGAWDSSMANDFYSYTKSKGYKIYAFEFGNEIAAGKGIEAQIPASQYAIDFVKFADLTRSYFGNEPKLIAPDGTFDATFLQPFLSELSNKGYLPDIVTNHIYSLGAGSSPQCGLNAMDPKSLDGIKSLAAQVVQVNNGFSPSSKVWMGEGGGAYNSGRNGVTNAFNSPFWYLDQMAIFSSHGFGSYCRQTLVGGFYSLLNITGFEPAPDYYALLTWSKVMGFGVLNTTVTDSVQESYLRAYAHCSQYPAFAAGSITVLLINLDNKTASISAEINFPELGLSNEDVNNLERHEYIFTSFDGPDVVSKLRSRQVNLNGVLLQSLNNNIPNILPNIIPKNSNSSIVLESLSYGFFIFPSLSVSSCYDAIISPSIKSNKKKSRLGRNIGIGIGITFLFLILIGGSFYYFKTRYQHKRLDETVQLNEETLNHHLMTNSEISKI